MKPALVALSFVLGAGLPWISPFLLPTYTPVVCVTLGLFLMLRGTNMAMMAFLAGFGYGQFATLTLNSHQLPETEQAIDARVTGQVVSLPQADDRRVRFRLHVRRIEATDLTLPLNPRRLRLSWYYPEIELQPGQILELQVRLRRPRGLANFGLFDYRRWLLAEHIDGTGYVRNLYSTEPPGGKWIDRWRFEQRAAIYHQNLKFPELVAALGIGDRSGIKSSQWDTYATTGVIHLMVISGLHIGFAALTGFLVFSVLLRPAVLLHPLVKAPSLGWAGSLVAALAYTACAGFSVPAIRAFLMIGLFAVSRFYNRNWSIWMVITLSLAISVLLDPRIFLATGFWLSYAAVVVLVAAFQGSPRRSWLWGLVSAQLALFIGFSAIPLLLGNSISVMAPLVNLIAVPIIGLVVVPLILVGLFAGVLASWLQQMCWHAADWILGHFQAALEYLAHLESPQIQPLDMGNWLVFVPLVAGLLFVSLPHQRRFKVLLMFAFLPLIANRDQEEPLKLEVLDVGQGTSVLVRQPGYHLIYDAGPAFDSGFNTGKDIVLPRLLRQGSGATDMIISHADNDHAGGSGALAAKISGHIFTGELIPQLTHQRPCQAGQNWRVGNVHYQVLHPDNNFVAPDNNDNSCVLLITYGEIRILLTGDISERVENRLLDNDQLPESVDVLLIPHHGSNTSSSISFVTRLKPKFALVSAGYGNSFHHPAQKILQRYQTVGSQILNTAYSGALLLSWTSPSEIAIATARQRQIFWWQE